MDCLHYLGGELDGKRFYQRLDIRHFTHHVIKRGSFLGGAMSKSKAPASDKLPALHFYPGDWKKDPGVQALDLEARGFWLEILFLMFESSERGVLLLNGKPYPVQALANCFGLDKQKASTLLNILLEYGVAHQREDGAIYSKRMIKDEDIRQKRIKAGSKGGSANLLPNLPSKTEANGKQNPEDEDAIEDEDEDQENTKEESKAWKSPAREGDPLEKYLAQSDPYFDAPTDQPWTKKNGFINLGRMPLRKYPRLWMTPRTLAEAFQLYESRNIPKQEWNRAIKKVNSKIESDSITPGTTAYRGCDLYDAGEALKTWALKDLMETLTSENRYKKSAGIEAGRQAETQGNYHKQATIAPSIKQKIDAGEVAA
jgi:hypothetical protein